MYGQKNWLSTSVTLLIITRLIHFTIFNISQQTYISNTSFSAFYHSFVFHCTVPGSYETLAPSPSSQFNVHAVFSDSVGRPSPHRSGWTLLGAIFPPLGFVNFHRLFFIESQQRNTLHEWSDMPMILMRCPQKITNVFFKILLCSSLVAPEASLQHGLATEQWTEQRIMRRRNQQLQPDPQSPINRIITMRGNARVKGTYSFVQAPGAKPLISGLTWADSKFLCVYLLNQTKKIGWKARKGIWGSPLCSSRTSPMNLTALLSK